MPEMISVPEAARLLRVDPRTVRAAIARGEIRGVVRFGRIVRIPVEELRAPAAEASA